MSNQACLYAEDTPSGYNPEAKGHEPQANTLFVAGAAYQIPVYWLFCFDSNTDFVEVKLSDGEYSTLVSPVPAVRKRLAQRDALARALFPEYVADWERWRRVVESVDRQYLKLDPYELWQQYIVKEIDVSRLVETPKRRQRR